MKKLFHIFTIALVAVSLLSCEKEPINIINEKDNDIEVSIDANKYITFQTDVATRGTLMESKYITGDFGVYGYQYDFGYSWGGQRAEAVADVFWNGTENAKLPLKVSENNGTYTYEASNAEEDNGGQITWSSNRYAFFAYSPYTHTKMACSSMESEGAPYLTYTVDKTNAANHADIITGGKTEVTAASSHNTVSFTMQHRLSGVDVSLCNAYVHSYSNNDVNVDEDVDIEISHLELEFSDLKYDKAKIFLEINELVPSLTTIAENTSGNTTAKFLLIGEGSNSDKESYILVPTDNKNSIITVDTKTSMTFIPQTFNSDDDLKVKATVIYRMKSVTTGDYIEKPKVDNEGDYVDKNGNKIPLDANGDPTTELYIEGSVERPFTVIKESNFNQPLVEGSRYYVVLTFTSEAVSINIVTAAAWDEEKLDFEFV